METLKKNVHEQTGVLQELRVESSKKETMLAEVLLHEKEIAERQESICASNICKYPAEK
jgi:hypothetical protein